MSDESQDAAVAAALRMFGLPPFFTLQPVAATQQTQLGLWGQLIRAAAATTKGAAIRVDKDCPLFENKRLGQRLDQEGRAAVLAHLADAHASHVIVVRAASGTTGEAPSDWQDAGDPRAVIVTSQPVSVLFESTAAWVKNQGQLSPTVAAVHTIEELALEDAMNVRRSSAAVATKRDGSGALNDLAASLISAGAGMDVEALVRAVLGEYHSGARRSEVSGVRVALFNLDGSSNGVFQGAKFTLA